jgi:hypothetical protein
VSPGAVERAGVTVGNHRKLRVVIKLRPSVPPQDDAHPILFL